MITIKITKEVVNTANNVVASSEFRTIACEVEDFTNVCNKLHTLAKSDNVLYELNGSSLSVRYSVKVLDIMSIEDFNATINNVINANIDSANIRIRQHNTALAITNKRLARHRKDELQQIDKFDYMFCDKYELLYDEQNEQYLVY